MNDSPKRLLDVTLPRFQVLLLAVAFVACASGSPVSGARRSSAQGRMITHDQIMQSGATNGWEAIRKAGTFLDFRDNARGDSARVLRRGASSLVLSNQVLLVVDEAQIADLQHLRNIPAQSILSIEILSASQGTVRYGTSAGSGVVVVRTIVPLHPST